MSSLHPAFEELLDRMSRRSARLVDRPPDGEPEPRVDVHVLFTGSIDALVAVGFTPMVLSPHPRRTATVAAGTAPVGRLRELADLEQVEFVEAPPRHEQLLEESLPDIRADVVHRPPLSLTGRNVIVAVVDGGFDLTHPAFRKEDGSSRVLGCWDQDGFTTSPATGGPPQPFNFGWAWTNEQITAALGADPLPSWLRPHFPARDAGESDSHYQRRQQLVVKGMRHGTHVAGIAAGNGRGRTGCVGNHFLGVAPESDLILVRCRRSDDPIELPQSVLTYALNYIWRIADDLDRPVVVNYSRGSNAGPHDGNTVEELMIEAALLPLTGNRARALVVAAGNEGDANHHARATVASGGEATAENVNFSMPDVWPGTVEFEIWYPGAGDLEIAFVVPGLWDTQLSPYATPGGPEVTWTFPPGAAKPNTVTIRSYRNDFRNHDNFAWVSLTLARTEGLPSISPARFAIRLANTEAVPTTADIWALTFEPELHFTSHQSAETTVTTPATANRAIAVGSYNKPLIFGLFGGGIADYSSHGPVRGPNPEHIEKPDLTAPGTEIYSARADIGPDAAEQIKESYGEICDCCTDEYMTSTGTSMAAPHVAGVIALMMQREPELFSDAFQPRLRSTARRPDNNPGPSAYDPVWGYGKVDAATAVSPNLPAAPPVPAPVGGSGADMRPGPGTLLGFADRLAALPETATLTTLISLHFAEVRALIDSRPRVAVTWHRLEGPRLLRSLRALADVPPGPWRLDLTMDLAPAHGRVRAFLDALTRNGSAQLRRDIAAHGDALLALLAPESLTRVARAAGLIG